MSGKSVYQYLPWLIKTYVLGGKDLNLLSQSEPFFPRILLAIPISHMIFGYFWGRRKWELYSDVRAQRQSQSGPREKILLEKKYYRMMWRWHSNFLQISIYINKMLSLQSKYREHKWKPVPNGLWMYLNQLTIAKILTARLHIHIRKVHFFNPEGNSVLRIPSQYPKHRKSQRIIRRFQGYHTGLIKRSFLRHPSNNFEQGKRQTRQVESSRTVPLACVHLLFYWKSFFFHGSPFWPSLNLNIFTD